MPKVDLARVALFGFNILMNIQEEFMKDKGSLLTVDDILVCPFILKKPKMCQHLFWKKAIKIFLGLYLNATKTKR